MGGTPKIPRQGTKVALLEAAGAVFARVGFQAATIQEICEGASANIAAVNYHFGDKLRLYQEVLRYAHESAMKSRRRVDDSNNLSAEDQLQLFIRLFLEHLFGEGQPSWFARVIAHEMATPTPALTLLIEQEARPGFERLKKIISDIIVIPVTDDEVVLCANSVMGQCLHYFHSRQVVAELWPGLKMTGERVDQIASHIARFSLLALAQIRQGKSGAPAGSRITLAKKRGKAAKGPKLSTRRK